MCVCNTTFISEKEEQVLYQQQTVSRHDWNLLCTDYNSDKILHLLQHISKSVTKSETTMNKSNIITLIFMWSVTFTEDVWTPGTICKTVWISTYSGAGCDFKHCSHAVLTAARRWQWHADIREGESWWSVGEITVLCTGPGGPLEKWSSVWPLNILSSLQEFKDIFCSWLTAPELMERIQVNKTDMWIQRN